VQQQGANAIRDEVLKWAPTYGVKVVADEHFLFGERDFRTIWLKVREATPDLILVQGFDPEFPLLLRHRKQMGVEIPLSSIEWFSCTDDWADLPAGSWQVGSAWTVGQGSFSQKVAAKDPRIKNLVMSAYTHDSVGILVNAYEAWGKTHAEGKPVGKEIAELIHTSPYMGALGALDIDKQGVIDSPVGLWIVENGVVKPVDLAVLKAKLGR